MYYYKEELTRAMELLSRKPRTIFIGQTVLYPGSVVSDTLKGVPSKKKIELPVAEEMQMGMSIGLALEGYLPISIYPRIDFLLLAINQLSNHLDILEELSHEEWKAKVIIRTIVGASEPLDPGPQHCRDHTNVFKELLYNVNVVKLDSADCIVPEYTKAFLSDKSTLLIELGANYD